MGWLVNILFVLRWQIKFRKKCVAEGKNLPIPVIPFGELCNIVHKAVVAIPSIIIYRFFLFLNSYFYDDLKEIVFVVRSTYYQCFSPNGVVTEP